MKEYTVVTYDRRVVVKALFWNAVVRGKTLVLVFYDTPVPENGVEHEPCAAFTDWYSLHSGDCIVSEKSNNDQCAVVC